jgi:hypothetical protein
MSSIDTEGGIFTEEDYTDPEWEYRSEVLGEKTVIE